jgi:DNA mismatch repair ATPase MutS
MEPAMAESMFLATSWLSIIGLLYGGIVNPMFDFESAVLPIRRRLLESNHFVSAIEAVAAIDELLSFVTYSQAVPHPTSLPEVTNGGVHYFFAENLRNPVMAKNDKNFVANDVDLDAPRLSFITGPNSGGKTTYCKTIAQSQILGQIGAPIVATRAKINMTDKLTYQAPAFDTLNDPEGRFGTELKETRDIFYSVTPKSLAILDEIAEGTTAHEKMNFSVDIMNGLHAIGCNTLLVTHSAELVERFQEMEKGQYLQVEFDGDKPTHRLIHGISLESHAYRVARKIGFASEDIARYLQEKGYM